MSTFNIGNVSGSGHQIGENNTQNTYGNTQNNQGAQAADPVLLATRLVELLRAERPDLALQAELVEAEIAGAQAEGRALNRGRVQSWLATITAGAGAGSAALTLAQAVGGAVGL